MVTYAVNVSNVQEVADEMGAVAKYISGLLEDLDNGAKQNLAEWAGSAREAGDTAKAQWDAAAADMAVQAANAQNSLSLIVSNYANAEYQGLGLWGG